MSESRGQGIRAFPLIRMDSLIQQGEPNHFIPFPEDSNAN
jgi:hypothetical protein